MFKGNVEHYFGVGESALGCILQSLLVARKDLPTVRRILDLPSGFGRVLRNLRAAFPDAELTACDIETEGVDFCSQEFGAVPVYSDPDLAKVELSGGFDLIWCGSLLTHLDAAKWQEVVGFLSQNLAPGGLLLVTTHGRMVEARIARDWDYGLERDSLDQLTAAFREGGFGYVNYPLQPDYGISLSSPAWTMAFLQQLPNLRVVSYTEAAWDGHQDVVACVNEALNPPRGPAT